LRIPLSSSATTVGKGSLRSRVIALGWSQWTADCRTCALVRELLVSDADIETDDTAKTGHQDPSHGQSVSRQSRDSTLE